ncbi:hypothetical protein [Halomonas sp.]|uniref:hypothetical protein n=1 Tax=Halomonas sp. TaxID=1486246 RepID=UPI003F90F033
MPFINDRLEKSRESADLGYEEKAKERSSRFRFDPALVMQRLRERIVGQEGILNAMEAMLHVVKADIGAEERPLAVNLFLGPTGWARPKRYVCWQRLLLAVQMRCAVSI